MRSKPSYGPFIVAVPVLLAVVGAVAFGLGSFGRAAAADEKLVAGSVCEAHELRARQAEDPSLVVEIPAQFDQRYPTRAACLSYEAAGNPDTPGPVQPIHFSHKHHAGLYQIDCQYCHSGTDRSRAAGVPSVEVCMGCHSQFPSSYDEFEGIRTLKDHWGIEVVQQDGTWQSLPRDASRARSIEWAQIYRLPEYVKFRHNRHIQAGFACQRCHGTVEQMDKVSMAHETHWWPWLLPTKTLEMGWCVNCHRENGASQDCLTCHY